MKRNKDYLICYDIADVDSEVAKGKKRLSSLAKYLERVAFRIQYSIFLLPDCSLSELEIIKEKIQELIDKNEDDVRVYTIMSNGYKLGCAVNLNQPFILI